MKEDKGARSSVTKILSWKLKRIRVSRAWNSFKNLQHRCLRRCQMRNSLFLAKVTNSSATTSESIRVSVRLTTTPETGIRYGERNGRLSRSGGKLAETLEWRYFSLACASCNCYCNFFHRVYFVVSRGKRATSWNKSLEKNSSGKVRWYWENCGEFRNLARFHLPFFVSSFFLPHFYLDRSDRWTGIDIVKWKKEKKIIK